MSTLSILQQEMEDMVSEIISSEGMSAERFTVAGRDCWGVLGSIAAQSAIGPTGYTDGSSATLTVRKADFAGKIVAHVGTAKRHLTGEIYEIGNVIEDENAVISVELSKQSVRAN